MIKIGSRESRLAVIQAELLQAYLEKQNIPSQMITMKTTGDVILNRTLDQVGGKGLFVRELDLALKEGRIDLAVHSLKDVPMEVSQEIPIIGFSRREDPRDVLVLPAGTDELDNTKPIGSSSRRRMLQAKKLFPGMRFESIRGNVLTRLKKLDSGEYSALILAAAGLKRLGLEKRISRYFDETEILPAAGQGILAVQARAGEDHAYLQGFLDPQAEAAAICERTCIRQLGGGCSSPVAAYAKIENQMLTVTGLYCEEDAEDYVTAVCQGDLSCPGQIGEALAEKLMQTYQRGRQNG